MSGNQERVLSFDVARGVGALGMVAVHVLLLYGHSAANHSIYGATVRLMGGPPAAPLFLFLMGASLAFSRRTALRQGLRRGFTLLALAYLLNLLRGTLPAFLGLRLGLITPRDLAFHTPADLFWIVDLLHCAGLSLLLLTAVQRFLPRPWMWVVLAAAVAIGSPVMWGQMSGWPPLDRWLTLLWGTGDTVQFPLLPWVSYPLAGMAFGVWLAASVDRDAVYRCAAAVGAMVFFVGVLLIMIRPAFHLGDYFRSGPGAVFAFTGFVLAWLSVCHWLVRRLRQNAPFRLLSYWGRHITAFYFVHWVILGWGIGLLGHSRYGVPTLLFLTTAVVALTDRLVRLWDRLRPRPAVAGRTLDQVVRNPRFRNTA